VGVDATDENDRVGPSVPTVRAAAAASSSPSRSKGRKPPNMIFPELNSPFVNGRFGPNET
jgi:hypothetical protein